MIWLDSRSVLQLTFGGFHPHSYFHEATRHVTRLDSRSVLWSNFALCQPRIRPCGHTRPLCGHVRYMNWLDSNSVQSLTFGGIRRHTHWYGNTKHLTRLDSRSLLRSHFAIFHPRTRHFGYALPSCRHARHMIWLDSRSELSMTFGYLRPHPHQYGDTRHVTRLDSWSVLRCNFVIFYSRTCPFRHPRQWYGCVWPMIWLDSRLVGWLPFGGVRPPHHLYGATRHMTTLDFTPSVIWLDAT